MINYIVIMDKQPYKISVTCFAHAALCILLSKIPKDSSYGLTPLIILQNVNI